MFDDKNLQTGDEVEFVNKKTLEKIGEGTLTEVNEKTFETLTDKDYEGHQRYSSEEAMYEHFKNFYPSEVIDKNTKVKIIKFDFRKI